MNTLDKNRAIPDWDNMIIKSWTYTRLTADERRDFAHVILDNLNAIKGTYKARWKLLNELYSHYLSGLGYKPVGWRESVNAQ